jgi:tetratricopeptide (TPR) repeat protein
MAKRAKTGRNDPCPCGSGRKFKVCHGAEPSRAPQTPSSGSRVETLFRESERHLRAGELDRAIPILHELWRLAPDDAMVTHNLGTAYLVAQRHDEALVWLRRSLEQLPTFARTHFHLGLVLSHLGDEDAAIAAFQRASELAPDLADAAHKAGDSLWAKGRLKDAIAAYERSFAGAPGTTSGRLARAKAFLVREEPEEARAVLEKLLERDPKSGEAHLVLGHIQTDLGQFDLAVTHYRRSIELMPDQATAYKGLVSAMRFGQKDRPILDRIHERLRSSLSERDRMSLCFAAGKAYDDLGEYGRAIECFDAANRVRKKLAPRFDRAEHEARIGRLLARFDRDFFARHAQLGDPDQTPILVLGMPRSGTTLVERILSAHPEAAGAGEVGYWHVLAPKWAEAGMEALTENAGTLRSDYFRALRAAAPRNRREPPQRITDKMPFNFLWIGLIHLLLPNARFVHVRRNPVDTCLSIYANQFAQDWPFASDRSDLASYYRQYVRSMEHWRSSLPPGRILDVDYEDVVAHTEDAARRIVAFAGLPWDAACLRPDQNQDTIRTSSKWQARQPIYRTSVERWRRYEPWLGELKELALDRREGELE